jgi:hypothetical protein
MKNPLTDKELLDKMLAEAEAPLGTLRIVAYNRSHVEVFDRRYDNAKQFELGLNATNFWRRAFGWSFVYWKMAVTLNGIEWVDATPLVYAIDPASIPLPEFKVEIDG